MERFQFPPWINTLLPALGLVGAIGAAYVGGVLALAVHPVTTDVGYQPEQPIPFSHTIHAGRLKMDCRYCHNTVEVAGTAAIPPVATCLNCHSGKVAKEDGTLGDPPTVTVHFDSAKLAPLRQAAKEGRSVAWRKVHDLPDYVYFDHSVHVMRGVSCVSCHGRVDTLDVVEQKKTLAMGFCLECHRDAKPSLRPRSEVFNLAWQAEGKTAAERQAAAEKIGQEIIERMNVHPSQNCSTCHR